MTKSEPSLPLSVLFVLTLSFPTPFCFGIPKNSSASDVAVSSKLKLLPVPARLTAQIFSCRRIGAQPAARPLLFALSNLALVLLLAVAFLALLVLETPPRAATLNRSLNRSLGGSQNGFSNAFSLCCKVVTLQTKPLSYDSCVSRPLE